MLDDLKMIHNRDSADTLGSTGKQADQLIYTFDTANVTAADVSGCTNIIYAGMGSSATAAAISQVSSAFRLPLEIVRGYELPAYISKASLYIAASQSGNTEEMLCTLQQAEAAKAKIIIMAGGGQLLEIAEQRAYPAVRLPQLLHSRFGLFYNLAALLQIADRTGLAAVANGPEPLQAQLEQARQFIADSAMLWRPEVPTVRNYAKQLAQELMGRSIVVYAGPKLYPAAYRWKTSCNENAKQVAWAGQLPEYNHNEMTGWSKQPIEKPYAVVELRSDLEYAALQPRFAVGERLLSGLRPAPLVVRVQGDSLLEQLTWACLLGDYVSIYLGLLAGTDPGPLPVVDKFKKELHTV